MKTQNALAAFTYPKSLVKRTQPRDRVDSFNGRTLDDRGVKLDVYERDGRKWFVVLTHAFAGWTENASAAFAIINNCGMHTLEELAALVPAAG